MRLNLYLFSTLLLLSLLLFSCSDSKKESKADQVEFSSADKKMMADIDRLLTDLPSPSEVPYTLQAAAVDYNEDLINDLSKVSGYQNNENKAALNLGIYATDIGYLTSYEQVQKTLNYVEECEKIAQSVGVAAIFDAQLVKSFQANLSNPDSLSAMMDDAIFKAGKSLQTAERMDVGGLMLAGSFIEGLYLSVEVIDNYPKDMLDESNRNLILEPLVRIVLNQKKALYDVIDLLKGIPHNEATLKMISELDILKLIYENDLNDIEMKISENAGNFVLTQDILSGLTTEVKRIRSSIVE